MTDCRPKSKTIDLRNLLAPCVQEIVTKGCIFKDPQYSLYYTAREAIGWQNWMQERQLQVAGSPLEIVQQAARSLELSSTEVNQAIAKASQENCVPSAKFMDKRSDVSCWMRVADLNGWLFKARCPTDVQLEALERMSQHRALNPELAAQRDILRQQKQASPASHILSQQEVFSDATAPTQAVSQQHSPVERQANVPQIEFETLETTTPQQHLNTQVAQMGRQLIAEVGAEQDGQQSLDGEIGRAQYKIVLDLTDNTMRIYAQNRGTAPILVDANGNIDHTNAHVLVGDIEAFQSALNYLERQRQSATGIDR